jgi:hypothetical protein
MRKFNVRWWAGPRLSQWRMIRELGMYDPGPFWVHGAGWTRRYGPAKVEPWCYRALVPIYLIDVQEGGKVRIVQ